MWILVGLGNPGSKYSKTRHNIGFRVIDHFSETHKIPIEEKDSYMIGRGTADGHEVVLLKPLTFMNRSGQAVRKVLKKFNKLSDKLDDVLLVVQDDLDIEPGVVKIRKEGSSGGHKGIESVIQETGTRNFIRVKVGIGRDKSAPTDEYVLAQFRSSEKNLIKDAIINAADAVLAVVKEGADKAMNKYNRTIQAGRTGRTGKSPG